MMIAVFVLKQAERELADAPKDIRLDIDALFYRLTKGVNLGLPISRPLYSVFRGLHELRLSGRAGEYRVFYWIRSHQEIYVLHGMQKKKQELDRKTVDLLKMRIGRIL